MITILTIFYEILQEYNAFSIVSFLLPFIVFYYYMRKDKLRRYETYDSELKKMQHNFSHYERYVDKKSRKNDLKDLSDDELEEIDPNDRDILYLKKSSKTYEADESDVMDRTSELIEFFKKKFSAAQVFVYPKTFDVVKECLKVCDGQLILCDESVSRHFKKICKEIDVEILYFRRNDVEDFIKKVSRSDEDLEKYLYLECIGDPTGEIIDKFIQRANDSGVRIILKDALSTIRNKDNVDAVIYDTTYLNVDIDGFAFASKAFARNLQQHPLKLSNDSFGKILNFQEQINSLSSLSKDVHNLLKDLKKFDILSNEESYVKVFNVNIDSSREDYNRTLQRFCKALSVYVDREESGVVLHLHSTLCGNDIKLNYLKKVLTKALIFCLEKESVAQRL